MQTLLKLLKIVGISILLTSCATKVVVIDSSSDVVRLGNNVKGSVYIQQQDGSWTKCKSVHLPEGWYAGPGPKE